jgi:hypothetical protein
MAAIFVIQIATIAIIAINCGWRPSWITNGGHLEFKNGGHLAFSCKL